MVAVRPPARALMAMYIERLIAFFCFSTQFLDTVADLRNGSEEDAG